MIVHEDDRRILYDWANGDFKSVKAIIIKDNATQIGDHFHDNKDEEFFLLKGQFLVIQIGRNVRDNKYGIRAPYSITVERGTYHRFVLTKGSILLCAATEVYDEKDEIK